MSILPHRNRPEAGVYAIENRDTGYIYVGATTQGFDLRWKQHVRTLKRNRHMNPTLQRDWWSYGEDAFRFRVLEIVSNPLDVYYREAYWIDKLDRVYNKQNRRYIPLPTIDADASSDLAPFILLARLVRGRAISETHVLEIACQVKAGSGTRYKAARALLKEALVWLAENE